MSKEFAAYSSVAILESPESFIVQHRPNLRPGSLAYAGKYQLLGGHRDLIGGQLESADVAIIREISEETNLGTLPIESVAAYWQGPFEGHDSKDEPIIRHVSCFHLGLSAVQATGLKLQKREGELVHIPKSLESIDAQVDRLAPFAHIMLASFLRGKRPEL
jgi:ADP-ribose pyrophosphatase YjhB (NUDIX family)